MNNPCDCPHFTNCSGCTIAEAYHPPIWEEALAYFKMLGIDAKFIVDGFSQTRFKAKLAVREGPKIGLFAKNTHEVIAIPHCLVHHPKINEAVSFINETISSQKVVPYRENPPSGTLRYLQLFVERKTGKLQLTLVVNNDHNIEKLTKELLKKDLWHSIWINRQPKATNQIFSDDWKRVFGEAFLWQTLNDTPIAYHPGAFSQVHLPLFEKMIQRIISWVYPHERVLELYAGVGAIGLNLQGKVSSIELVENNPYAYASFQQTNAPIPYHLMDAKKADFSHRDLVIVDPPRKGLDPEIIHRLESDRLIYISCGFASFKRDTEELLALGWKLKKADGYLLFPGTNHVETLSLFEK